jgi:hypothetical protein
MIRITLIALALTSAAVSYAGTEVKPSLHDCALLQGEGFLGDFERARRSGTPIGPAEYRGAFLHTKAKVIVGLRDRLKDPTINDLRIVPPKNNEHPKTIKFEAVSAKGTIPIRDSHLIYELYPKGDNSIVSSTIFVHKNFRDLGISKLMMLEVLQRHPGITRMGDSLINTNRAFFVSSFLNTNLSKRISDVAILESDRVRSAALLKSFADRFHRLKSPEEVILFRDGLIDAFRYGTPSGRMKASVGFEKLESLAIELSKDLSYIGYVRVKVARGLAVPNAEVSVVVLNESKVGIQGKLEIRPDGSIVKIN